MPKPSRKLRPLAWSKVNPSRVIGKQNVWTKFQSGSLSALAATPTEAQLSSSNTDNYFRQIEELFMSSSSSSASATAAANSSSRGGADSFNTSSNQAKDLTFRETTKNWHNSEKVSESRAKLNAEHKILYSHLFCIIFCIKINLLDSKRSLNINISLKQFRW